MRVVNSSMRKNDNEIVLLYYNKFRNSKDVARVSPEGDIFIHLSLLQRALFRAYLEADVDAVVWRDWKEGGLSTRVMDQVKKAE